MSKASDFILTDKSSTLQMQTLTNRDFINRIYILRYEDCVDQLRSGMDYHANSDFLAALTKLYWSFIVPRKFTNPKLSNFTEDRINALDGKKLFEDIAVYLHQMGVNRPEKEQADLDHIVIEEMEVGTTEYK